jgi:hypothetical protein
MKQLFRRVTVLERRHGAAALRTTIRIVVRDVAAVIGVGKATCQRSRGSSGVVFDVVDFRERATLTWSAVLAPV